MLDMAIHTDHVEEIADQTRTISRVKSDEGLGKEDEHDDVAAEKQSHIVHPEPWAFEKWIPGGYSQSRMLRFKNPSTMYKVINLFAGKLARQDQGNRVEPDFTPYRICDLLLWV